MNEKSIIAGVIVLLVAVSGVLFVMSGGGVSSSAPSSVVDISGSTTPLLASDNKVVQLAQCLKDNGAVFYGAFWCPHCMRQKELFGKEAFAALTYVECSTPDGNSQTQACKDKKIESYPTWEFKDGSRLTGEVSLKTLAEKTSCVDPSQTPSGTTVASTSLPL